MAVKGLTHVHSNFSDGDLSLEEVKEKALKLGMSFVSMADHIEQIGSQQRLNEMREKCQQLSDKNFLMIPGFEVSPKRDYHLLVYNCRQFINRDPTIQDLINFPFNGDQFLALAHASQYSLKKLPLALLNKLDGIEVWNARYDSRYAPNLKSLNYANRKNFPPLVGSDAHSIEEFEKLWIELELEKLEITEIFNALKKTRFKAINGLFPLRLDQPLNFYQKTFFGLVNYFFPRTRSSLVCLRRKGIKFPGIFKKIFHKFY